MTGGRNNHLQYQHKRSNVKLVISGLFRKKRRQNICKSMKSVHILVGIVFESTFIDCSFSAIEKVLQNHIASVHQENKSIIPQKLLDLIPEK